jgi:hypothetical protein
VDNASVLGRWTYFFNFEGTPFCILLKNILTPLEHKLLVVWKNWWSAENGV